jgi:hypothetical protein
MTMAVVAEVDDIEWQIGRLHRILRHAIGLGEVVTEARAGEKLGLIHFVQAFRYAESLTRASLVHSGRFQHLFSGGDGVPLRDRAGGVRPCSRARAHNELGRWRNRSSLPEGSNRAGRALAVD